MGLYPQINDHFIYLLGMKAVLEFFALRVPAIKVNPCCTNQQAPFLAVYIFNGQEIIVHHYTLFWYQGPRN